MTGFTRRKMLTIAAATAATAAGSATLPEPAAADDAADLGLFVKLSGALTGIDEARLAPPVDPIQVKHDYFNQAKLDPAFDSLMQIIRADPANPTAAADKVMNNADPRIKYLGRSIILAWYLGAWYEPKTLQQPPPPIPPVPAQKVISPAAYTQAWTWRVAQAHPMGYSELRFGYWSDDPAALNDFIKG
jgi:hypothetical protein